jgi:hypothetical protein
MASDRGFDSVVSDVVRLLDVARRSSARSVNAILTSTYWAIGRRIVEEEQQGSARARYGEELLKRLGEAAAPRGKIVPTALALSSRFPLPWSHYVALLGLRSREAREFYEREALRGGWTHPQLERQIATDFYERTTSSRITPTRRCSPSTRCMASWASPCR